MPAFPWISSSLIYFFRFHMPHLSKPVIPFPITSLFTLEKSMPAFSKALSDTSFFVSFVLFPVMVSVPFPSSVHVNFPSEYSADACTASFVPSSKAIFSSTCSHSSNASAPSIAASGASSSSSSAIPSGASSPGSITSVSAFSCTLFPVSGLSVSVVSCSSVAADPSAISASVSAVSS